MREADLISRAWAGDGDAFQELTGPYRRELQVHCYRMLGSFQDAEDACVTALQVLPPRQLAVLVLGDVLGFHANEVADMLDSTVESRAPLAADAARHERDIDLMAPVLEQAALAELITSGNYERHIRRTRTGYKRRRDLLVGLIAEELPNAQVRGASAGLHVLVETPETAYTRVDTGDSPAVADEAAVELEAAQRGVQVIGLGRHRGAPGPPGFVLGYGHLSEDQLCRGLRGFAAAIRACQEQGSA